MRRTQPTLAGFEDEGRGPQKCGQFLKAGKSKGTDIPLGSPEWNAALWNPDFGPIRPLSGFDAQNYKK